MGTDSWELTLTKVEMEQYSSGSPKQKQLGSLQIDFTHTSQNLYHTNQVDFWPPFQPDRQYEQVHSNLVLFPQNSDAENTVNVSFYSFAPQSPLIWHNKLCLLVLHFLVLLLKTFF